MTTAALAHFGAVLDYSQKNPKNQNPESGQFWPGYLLLLLRACCCPYLLAAVCNLVKQFHEHLLFASFPWK